uniref:Uncharacterized protein n=1 Tax=Anguilla anguilla TaxID=7936 RepID=A0A0E9V8E6_ANGAN
MLNSVLYSLLLRKMPGCGEIKSCSVTIVLVI